ncbi:MAG: carboxypeptidase regulatory-like domain-containing protein [Candidatus Electryonea clarkiae]|nr:carboxypeptidase regulatory-like domain-containing protein [Candidatus Electryonea clarkiae]MDP8288863.1 carboxypeptidase regulatory-like domain-containing protein [Candidatus Electryonea clarkiae]
MFLRNTVTSHRAFCLMTIFLLIGMHVFASTDYYESTDKPSTPNRTADSYGLNVSKGPVRATDYSNYDFSKGYHSELDIPITIAFWCADGGSYSGIIDYLEEFDDIESIDQFNAAQTTPDLEDLEDYDLMWTCSNSGYNDREALGDVMADYVDEGGAIIMTMFAFAANNWYPQGRFLDEDYFPMNHATYTQGPSTLAEMDEGHPIMEDVETGFAVNWYARNEVAEDAEEVGTLAANYPYCCAKPQIVGFNANMNNTYTTATDARLTIHNAMIWAVEGDGEVDATMDGFVTNVDTGEPVEGAIIRVSTGRDTTDGEGYYSMDARSGERSVRILHEDYNTYNDEIVIDLGENTFNFEMIPLSPVSGTLTDIETGNPVEDASVTFGEEEATSDENGYWEVAPQAMGEYVIFIESDEYTSLTDSVEVEEGENTFNYELMRLSEVSGTIIDVDTEEPIEDASVMFGVERATTDENGYWDIPLQEQGAYRYTVTADHYYDYSDNVDVEQGDNVFDIELIPLATLSGNITDSETDLPLEGAEIILVDEFFDYSAISDVNGDYSIIDIQADDYPVEISLEGYFNYEDDIEIEERENIIDFAIDILSAELSGVVRDELTEELLFGATVTVIDEVTGETMYEVLTDEAGEYTTGTLHDSETFLVIASMGGYAPSDTEEVLIRWNRENVQDFELTPIFARGIRQLQQEQDLETWVTTSGIVTQGTNVTDTEETSIYIQDESGWGIMIWSENPWDPENNINRGDGVTVIGFLVEEDEMTRITNFEIEVTSNDNPLPDPIVETTGDMSGNEQREGTWGQISGQINRDPPGEDDFSLIVDDGSGQCEVRIVETTGIDMSAFSANDWGTFTGVIGLSRQGLRLIPNMQDDITRIAIDPPSDLASEQEVVPGDPLQLEVTLNWAHDHLDAWLRFKIYRDGEHIGNTQQNTWSEKLEDPIPGDYGSYTYEYEVTAVYDEGETEGAEIEVIWDITLVHERPYSGVPTEWALEAVYPNPFNPTLHVVLGVPQVSIVTVEIMDILGRRVAVLHQGELSVAYHRVGWNATGNPTGLYFLRVSSNTGFNQISKVMFIK